MSKKKKKKMPVPRKVWGINPKSRVRPSKKIYRRAKLKSDLEGELEHFSET